MWVKAVVGETISITAAVWLEGHDALGANVVWKKIGRLHAGKTVTIAVEDTHFRILHGTEELAVHPRTTTEPIRHFKAPAPRMTHQGKASPDDTRETIS